MDIDDDKDFEDEDAEPLSIDPNNPYTILGVSPTASTDEIKRAYRKLMQTAHPDQGGATDQAARINEAYKLLIDPERRRHYDQTGQDLKQDDFDKEAFKTRVLADALFTYTMSENTRAGEHNVIDAIEEFFLKPRIKKARKHKRKLERKIEKALQIKRRFYLRKKVGGEDLVGSVLREQLATMEHALRDTSMKLEVFEKVQEELSRYIYKTDGEDASSDDEDVVRLIEHIVTDGIRTR